MLACGPPFATRPSPAERPAPPVLAPPVLWLTPCEAVDVVEEEVVEEEGDGLELGGRTPSRVA